MTDDSRRPTFSRSILEALTASNSQDTITGDETTPLDKREWLRALNSPSN
ncbi:hypothetical protein [Microbacterium testaceum]|nr:hypothetical protein [Microbacterium testaceum]MCC4247487.1 hypothetical protein [Microbacterium testaceum]